ncbi:MAG TPA: NAD(P)/FAD-dependent oxidoreductase [Flavobacteriaceae bacterium]|nr:NAD(P)/FAD-dependent oxidoreductase [Flavobacteriaceae bacterium]
MNKKVIIVGGGAAGFFAAINIAENRPDFEVIIIEKSDQVLQKVKISGGGRCNITNACFDPKELIKFYPRGGKELLGPFHQFMTGDTLEWFESRGIPLKIEDDNRVFPSSNSSQTIVDFFTQTAQKLGVKVLTQHRVATVLKSDNQFEVVTSKGNFKADIVLMTTGSNNRIYQVLNTLGHTIIHTVPSLFTFEINDNRLKTIPGISVPNATVQIQNKEFLINGPLLITHWGMSGPAILKLSAFAARYLAEVNYYFDLEVNWLSKSEDIVLNDLKDYKLAHAKKTMISKSPFSDIPNRLWEQICLYCNIDSNIIWADCHKNQIQNLTNEVTKANFKVTGKSAFKDEFVMAGGVDLKEINFKKMESKIHPNLYFAGEILNIDAVTGGFNFQNAWTGAYIASSSIIEN